MTQACSCTPTVSDLKPYEQALHLLLAQAKPLQQTERVPLMAALGRVLAEPVVSRINVPAWDNSGMDGYAVRAQDLPANGTRLKVSQRIPAGVAPQPLQPGTAARIFTGAPVPQGADTVIMQESCCADGDSVLFNQVPPIGENIRRAGEDIIAGQPIIEVGTRLLPQHLGLAASVGVGELCVTCRLRVAVLASGDELLMPGETLTPGKIYNSNLFTAVGMLQGLGCEVIETSMVEDTLEATKQALAEAASKADLVLASGGVSVGEEDHVKPAVEMLGSLDMWKIAIRPGKPLAFGHIGGTPFIGSPGNPVALFVTFMLLARPFILRLMGVSDCLPKPVRVRAGFHWDKPDKRREFHRARLQKAADGTDELVVHSSRSSGVLSSVTWADGLVMIAEGQKIAPGDLVDYFAFSGLLS